MIKEICIYCGGEVLKRPSEIKNSSHVFCNHTCFGKWLSEKKLKESDGRFVECDFCGKEIYKTAYKLRSYKNQFCSTECKNKYQIGKGGENHPNYKKVEVECANCGETLLRVPSDIERNNDLYCNNDCFVEHKIRIGFYKAENNPSFKGGLVETECDYCGKEQFRKQCHIRDYKLVFCSQKCMGNWYSENKSGENSVSWKGGITPLYQVIRSSRKYKGWLKGILSRDKYTCQDCGYFHGCRDEKKPIHVHHKKHLSTIMDEYKIRNKRDIVQCDELWDIGNGITLCSTCHQEKHPNIKLLKV